MRDCQVRLTGSCSSSPSRPRVILALDHVEQVVAAAPDRPPASARVHDRRAQLRRDVSVRSIVLVCHARLELCVEADPSAWRSRAPCTGAHSSGPVSGRRRAARLLPHLRSGSSVVLSAFGGRWQAKTRHAAVDGECRAGRRAGAWAREVGDCGRDLLGRDEAAVRLATFESGALGCGVGCRGEQATDPRCVRSSRVYTVDADSLVQVVCSHRESERENGSLASAVERPPGKSRSGARSNRC